MRKKKTSFLIGVMLLLALACWLLVDMHFHEQLQLTIATIEAAGISLDVDRPGFESVSDKKNAGWYYLQVLRKAGEFQLLRTVDHRRATEYSYLAGWCERFMPELVELALSCNYISDISLSEREPTISGFKGLKICEIGVNRGNCYCPCRTDCHAMTAIE